MRIVADVPTDGETLERLLEGFIEASRKQWRENPQWKPLYETTIRYKRTKPGPERLQTSQETRQAGHGDCDRLVVDRVAELRERQGEDDARAYVYQTGPNTWHAVVRRADGSIEDPSRIQVRREKRGWPQVSINGEDEDAIPAKAAVDITEMASGRKVGKITWQTSNARITIEALGDSPAHAAERAVALAKRVASHPALKAFVPPQAALAVAATEKLVSLAKSGELAQVAKRLKGPARALARKLFG